MTAPGKAGYCAYAGRKLQGWPVTVLRRGATIVLDGKVTANTGSGRFLVRTGGWPAEPTGRLENEVDPMLNHGAKILD